MEFKVWVTDYSKRSFQGITDDGITKFPNDIERMVLQQAQMWIARDQTKKEQGTWLTKTMVSMWFKNETNLMTLIDLLKIVKEELENAACKIN